MNLGMKKKNRPIARPTKTRIAAAPVSSTHAISDSDDDEPAPSTSRGISKHVMNTSIMCQNSNVLLAFFTHELILWLSPWQVPLIGSQPHTISDEDEDDKEEPPIKKGNKKRCGTGGRRKKDSFDVKIDQSQLPEWFHSEVPRRGTEMVGWTFIFERALERAWK